MKKHFTLAFLLLGLVAAGTLAALGGSASAQSSAPDQGSPWTRWQLTGTNLEAVDAISASDAWAVGSDGVLAHWDGARWTAIDNTKIGTHIYYSVDMVASNAVWATASGGPIMRYNGTTWADQPRNNGSTTLFDVSMVSTTDGWAVGTNATFMRYNGTDWQIFPPAGTITPTMYGVDMVSATSGWAVGGRTDASGTIAKIARWNGTAWTDQFTYNRILNAVDMLDDTYGWAVGSGGTLLEYNGTTWSPHTPPAASVSVQGISVVSRTEAYAVGSRNAFSNDLWRWDGTSWTALPTPNAAPLSGVKMLNSGDGWIVGQRGTVYRWNGTTATVVNSHWTSNGFYALDFVAPNDGWTTGVLNTSPPAEGLQRWNGTDWQSYPAPANNAGPIKDVDMLSSNQAWAVGSQAVLYWNGTAWSQQSVPGNFLDAISMVSPTDGWAVGSGGDIMHFDGTSWTNYTTPTTSNLWSIDMVNANEGWAGGISGLMLHYQNGTWTRIQPNPTTFTIEAIHMLSASEGWAVGYNGTILRYNGSAWTQQTSPTTENLLGVHMISSNEGWASGNEGTLLHYMNGTWTQVPVPTGRNIRDVYVFASGEGWAVTDSPGTKLYLSGAGGTPTVVPTASRTATSILPTVTLPAASATSSPVLPTGTSVLPTGTAALPTQTAGLPSSTRTAPAATRTSIVSTATAPAATATISQATPTACTVTFTDVQPTDTFYPFIRCLACRGIIGGYADGTFRPNNNITRGQIAKMVSNSAGFQEPISGQTFEDVPPASPFYVFIERLFRRGHMGGYPCGQRTTETCIPPENRPYFRPNEDATRGQMSKIVSNAAGYTEPHSGQFYTDVTGDNPFYLEIMRLTTRGVMSGYPCGNPEPCDTENRPYFRWGNPVTRGQASKIVANTFYPNCETP
jgi:hypothetical protein